MTKLITENGMKGTLENEKCIVRFDLAAKEVGGDDKTDYYNLPRFFNRNVRSVKKAVAALCEEFSETTSMYGAMDILDRFGLRCHSYCAMD